MSQSMSQSTSEPVRTAPLTAAEIAQYHDRGYVILGNIMSDEVLEAFRAEEARFRGNSKELTIFRSQLCAYSQVIRDFALKGPQMAMAKTLVGNNLAHWYNQFVTKLPDANSGKSEFPWHQDNGYVSILPANNVTIWVPLDDVDEYNGCVWVMPDSHKMGLLDHKSRSPDSWHLSVPVQGDGVPAILKAGHAVAFTGLTLHRSKLNHSDKARRAFFFEYCDAAATFHRNDDKPQPVITSPDCFLVSGQLAWKPQ